MPQFLAKIASEPHEVSVHAAPDEAVSVDMADPIAEYKYYDLSRGKPPQIHEGMLGNASPIFKCTTDFTIQPVKGRSSGPFKFRFMSASLSIELPITITLPTGTSPGLREHEEGHRKINEYFYTLGRKTAQHAGGLVLGKEFYSPGTDLESAQSNVLVMAGDVVQRAYWKYTRTPAQLANKYYDDVTDHGRNRTNSNQVVQEAIERYEVQLPGDPR